MNPVTVILVFGIVWWLVFFISLPIGVKAQNETDEGVVQGTVPSAPENPNLWKKALWTTIVTAIITGIYVYLVTSGYLASFRPVVSH